DALDRAAIEAYLGSPTELRAQGEDKYRLDRSCNYWDPEHGELSGNFRIDLHLTPTPELTFIAEDFKDAEEVGTTSTGHTVLDPTMDDDAVYILFGDGPYGDGRRLIVSASFPIGDSFYGLPNYQREIVIADLVELTDMVMSTPGMTDYII
ncbi:MAG: hypothetical protein ACK5KU_10355, partial [Beutenbergiaceae bacterium]